MGSWLLPSSSNSFLICSMNSCNPISCTVFPPSGIPYLWKYFVYQPMIAKTCIERRDEPFIVMVHQTLPPSVDGDEKRIGFSESLVKVACEHGGTVGANSQLRSHDGHDRLLNEGLCCTTEQRMTINSPAITGRKHSQPNMLPAQQVAEILTPDHMLGP